MKLNRDKVMEIKSVIMKVCEEPQTFEDILAQVFRHYELVMDFSQNVLVGSTVRSYLSWMKDEGQMTADIVDYKVYWKTL